MTEIISLKATNGIIRVFEDRVEISRSTAMGFMTQGIKGDRVYFYPDIVSVEYRKPTIMANGYLKLIVAGTHSTNAKVGLLSSASRSMQDENTLILRAFKSDTPKIADLIYEELMKRIKASKSSKQGEQLSVADEILKFKNLLDQGVITVDEYEKKKKQLLEI